MMTFLLSIILCFGLVVQVNSQLQQLTCKQCDKSSKGSCTKDQTCTHLQTRCLSVHLGSSHPTSPNTYTMRCATQDECSDYDRRLLCQDDDRNCVAQCCAYANCDPYYVPKFIQTAGRSHRCFQCNSESLDSCENSEQACDDDQDACLSLLMEGGNRVKVYTKRCARKDECVGGEQQRLCNEEVEESLRKSCRPSCCYEQLCNTAAVHSAAVYFVLVCLSVILVLVS